MNLSYFQFLNWVKPNRQKVLEWYVKVGRDLTPVFTLPNPELTAFPPGQDSYTYDILLAHGQPQPLPQLHARPPSPPLQPEMHMPPPYVPQPPPDQPRPDSETIWDLQSIGQAIGEVRTQVGDIRRMVGSLDQRLGYVERNMGRGLFPMYDDYARRGAIPDSAFHPDWFQPPPQGYVDPSSHGTYFDYSSWTGYGQDIPFGGPSGNVNPSYFGGSSSGGAGGSGGDFGRMDEDEDD